MSEYFYDGQTPNYRNNNNTTNIKLDTVNNQISIENTNINKTITINSTQFSNGTYSLPYTQMFEKINAVEACIYPPEAPNILNVNNTIKLNGTSSNNIIIQADTTPTQPANFIATDNSTYSSGLSIDKLFTADISSYPIINNSSEITPTNLIMIDTPGNIQLEFTNDINIYTEPTIRMQNNTGLNNYINFSGINADGHLCFNFTNNEKFFKLNNPFSYNIYTANDGDYIEKNYTYILADNITTLKLYNPNNYLDDNNMFGWSCIVSNLSGSDVQIDTAGFQWFAHSNGLNSSPIILKKWATCNLILLYSNSTVGDYVWAVSQF